MTIQVLGVDNIMFAVGDLAQARAFYETRLGLPIKFIVAQFGIVAYRLGAEEPGLILRVQPIEPALPRDTPRVWLEVADARAVAQTLKASGVALLGEPHEIQTGWVVEIADPWGNVIGLTDYVKDARKGRPVAASIDNANANLRGFGTG
jgi:predicted enzyme related to lactoylglutathione lyase